MEALAGDIAQIKLILSGPPHGEANRGSPFARGKGTIFSGHNHRNDDHDGDDN